MPAPVLAEVEFQTLCGLQRALRGASVGQFALIELTSSPGSARLVRAAQRLGLGPATEYARDLVFGIQGSTLLGDRFGDALLGAWSSGSSSLLGPLPASPA